ncbi:hypothetical protein B0H14DRAFT_2589929 [Mycena olivaceomarginata]|nr:hypothetical protein B0H14DRAFT_2589929 [Mycena olivaceomarginata]
MGKLGPKFGERMLEWWHNIGPAFRQGPRPEELAEGEEWLPKMRGKETRGEWVMLEVTGNNGLILVMQALVWWGQVIANTAAGEGLGASEAMLAAHTEWQYMLGDIMYALECMTGDLLEEDKERLEADHADEIAERAGKLKSTGAAKGAKKATAGKAAKGKVVAQPGKKTVAKQEVLKRDKQEEESDAWPRTRSRGSARGVAAPKAVLQKPKPPRNRLPPLSRGISSTATTAGERGPPSRGGGGAPAHPDSTNAAANATREDVEMPPATLEVPQGPINPNQDAENHPFGRGFDDPFNEDPTAGLSAEELVDLEAELQEDPDAEDDEDNGNEEEEE